MVDGFKSGDYRGATSSGFRMGATAEVGEIVDTSSNAGDAFVVQSAPLPAVGNCVGEWTDFVGAQAGEMPALAEEHSHVRAEELVSGADKKIAIERGDVDEAVRAVVDGINVDERANGVGEAGDFFDRMDGADGIRRVADRDQFSFIVDLRGKIIEVERAILFVNFCPADGDAFFLEREPGRDVG